MSHRIRTLLPVSALLLVGGLAHAQAPTSATAPPEDLQSYRFDGRLGFRTVDGSVTMLLPDAIFVGWGDGGCEIDHQSSRFLTVYPDGVFTLSIGPLVTTILNLDEAGRHLPSPPPVVRWPCYRFRVEGCDDVIVPFGPKPPDRSIELNCPGRAQPQRSEL